MQDYSGAMMGIGGGLGQLLFGGANPADSAMPYMNQIQGTLQQYLNPYVQMGQRAMGTLEGQYNNLLNDPTGMMNKIGGTFKSSPGYDFQLNQGLGAANRAAAAGGMLGSPMHQQNAENVAQGLANQDYWNYMNHGLGQYSQGLQGMQGLNQMGFQGANSLAENLASALMSQAQLAYAGRANQNQSQGGAMGSILGGVGNLLGSLL